MAISQDEAKRLAARAVIDDLPPADAAPVVLGLGSGSTAKLFVDEVGARVKAGAKYRGVPTSQGTRAQAEALGIPLLGDEEPWDVIVCVDGADEVDEHLNLIKGGGGCLTREKIVNHAAKRNLIVVDESKLSKRLGEKWPVPVEVLRFGAKETLRRLGELGTVTVRAKNGAPFVTDAGGYIYDVKVPPIDDPHALDRSIRSIPGVVETGLFLDRADVVVIAGASGVIRKSR